MMAYPKDIAIIDTLLDLPRPDTALKARFANLRDEASVGAIIGHAAGYMFKEMPKGRTPQSEDPVADTLREMDKHNIQTAVIGLSVGGASEIEIAALKSYSERFKAVLKLG